ncbi:phage virion morphogenesis protein [Aliivibrio sp. S4TY2]|uniref:phage virion morphogenesis protein n=1 Tax=unclassified Aliivibrio TaxID=2645654 RepID=UPI002378540E|nr:MULTISPECIES: phage virion morphogenesis protein [unclassified Aliivibrio]MDD9158543.1 phage virion morphogenesis protein [Aliivibrio sp. S4TY2]MDD9162543.1 phage virion morphogenesis protein [Aliivibrio sp. S4TY1]MDD9166542.1 phage virion morphogenesis protein [Aliivibrio sp. S4MY2]MDD9170543.1 phage virion morphogenesis protein [Aliivibrio sp. S4MY4]MDD9187622.1 phage virion morphogenesis protein [Aliivibrio sp. S4MY3]
MHTMQLSNPEQLTAMLESLALNPEKKFELNRKLANRTRQFFRAQIRQQRDVDNTPYQERTRRTRKALNNNVILSTKKNKNMLMGLSRALKTHVDNDSFEVGLTGIPAKIGREHNEGQTMSFTTRMNGFYNSRTNQWEGGVKTKANYRMPKRTFIGWTPSLERELMTIIHTELAMNMEP